MRRYPRFTVALSLMLTLAALLAMRAFTPGVAASHTCELRVWVNGNPTGPKFAVDPDQYPELCGAHTPTPTATPTMTMPMPTATGTPPAAGWHAPTTHEHGDAPPQWVLDSGHAPFTQTRESHVGYKGVAAAMDNGVQSYLITHILATQAARSHGDHDFQLWIKDPSGGISYWAGVMDFGSPPLLSTTDTGVRPIILSTSDGGGDGCETWYSRPGAAVMDVGWTICGRYQDFAGDVLGGRGLHRGADWVIPVSQLASFPGAAPSLAQYCVESFGVCRFSFFSSGHDFPGPDVVPIN